VDELDHKIVNELESKGFQKSATLAPLFGVGERTIRKRINDMRSKGILKIVALPNPVLLGYRAWAKIGIKVEAGSSYRVAHELIEHSPIYFVAYTIGTFDIIIAVHFYTIEQLAHFVNSELTKVKGILSTETMMLIHPRKYYRFYWPAHPFKETGNGSEPYLYATVSSNYYKLDEVDRHILGILEEDGLARPATLKSRLGVKESTIRKHIKNMLSNDVFKIEVVPNIEVLGYEAWATMGITINHQFTDKALNAIVKHPAVYLVSNSIGRFNIIIAARFSNIDALHQFVNIALPATEGVICIETFLHNKPLKYHNINFALSKKLF